MKTTTTKTTTTRRARWARLASSLQHHCAGLSPRSYNALRRVTWRTKVSIDDLSPASGGEELTPNQLRLAAVVLSLTTGIHNQSWISPRGGYRPYFSGQQNITIAGTRYTATGHSGRTGWRYVELTPHR